MTNNFGKIDVAVVGGGLAGLAAAFHLASTGLRVLCAEPEAEDKDPVGESRGWCDPAQRQRCASGAKGGEVHRANILEDCHAASPRQFKTGRCNCGRLLQALFRFGGTVGVHAVLRWGKPAAVLSEIPLFLPTLHMPTLIFHASHDPAIPEAFACRASELIPNASMVTVESGHFIPLNQPEPVATGLAGFFDLHSFNHGDAACA